ncbi:MAG TPA: hypothetical protein VI306_06025 [Pyrinomonadaceae bacterium]
MTAITYRNQHQAPNSAAQVWRCHECHCFHLLAGETLLTFTPDEFATFSQEVAECYCVQLQPNDNAKGPSALPF